MQNFNYPSPAELYALEQRARRQRAEEIVRLSSAAVCAVKSFFSRLFATRGPSAACVERQVAHHA